MQKQPLLTYLPWILAVFIAMIFVQSLFFKFSNSFETQHIFSTIGAWMADIGFPQGLANGFAAYGGYAVGTVELIGGSVAPVLGSFHRSAKDMATSATAGPRSLRPRSWVGPPFLFRAGFSGWWSGVSQRAKKKSAELTRATHWPSGPRVTLNFWWWPP